MTIPRALYLSAIVTVLFLISFIIFMPLRFTISAYDLGGSTFNAREVSGTIWSGQISDLHYKELGLGDVDTNVSLFSLLVGDPRFNISRPLTPQSAAIKGSFGTGFVQNLSAKMDASQIFSPLPVQELIFDNMSVAFDDENCSSASGSVGIGLKPIFGTQSMGELSGQAKCNAGKLEIALKSKAGGEIINLRMNSDGQYETELIIYGDYNSFAPQLISQGFEVVDGGYSLTGNGSL